MTVFLYIYSYASFPINPDDQIFLLSRSFMMIDEESRMQHTVTEMIHSYCLRSPKILIEYTSKEWIKFHTSH